jgi:VWFA-related protein
MERALMTRLRAIACAIVAAGVALHAQQGQQPTFRGGTDLVQLDVVVLDKDRHPVTGLTADDFVVLDDGKPRPIQAFAPVTLPAAAPASSEARAAWTRTVAGDVVTNQRADEGRLVVILMDRTIPMEGPTRTARAIAKAAVDALGPNDLAAIVRDTGFANDSPQQDFTADRQRLYASIDRPFVGLVNPPKMGPGGLSRGEPEFLKSGDCLCGLCALESLTRVATAMGGDVRRQKVLFFVGSNIIFQTQQSGDPCSLHLKIARERTFKALDRANVTLHSIDPSGLETLASGADAFPLDQQRRPSTTLERQGNLAVLPDFTGGRTVLNTNDPQTVVPAIFEESQSYYLIGIPRVEGGRDDDQRRNIKVRVKGRDDLIVRARTGYYAATPDEAPAPRDPVEASVDGVLPKTDLPLRVALTPRFRADGHVVVDVLLRVDDASREASTLDVLVGVFDEKAKPVTNARHTVELPAIGETQTRAEAELPPLDLKPGHYEVRIGVERRGDSTTGSVYGDVDVPDVGDESVALSGVTLQALPRPAGDAPLTLAPLLTMPTLRRTFTSGDLVTAFVQVRTKAEKDRASLTLHARIVDDQDRVALDAPIDRSDVAFDEAGVADVPIAVPVEILTTGTYLLTIEAVAGDRREHRDVPFEVR